MRRRDVASVIAVGAAAAYLLAVRSQQLRWGATGEERAATLAGDDLMANPDLTATRAITVHAAADQVWPWIAQLGQGRGGFYSYDALENLVGCNIHSADQIVPEWQAINVGDQVKLHPEVGPLSFARSRTKQLGCWSANATPTPSGGRRCWSSRLRWSPSL
jgi:hypothetical protein